MKSFKRTPALLLNLILLAGCQHTADFSQSVKDFEEKNAGKAITSLYFYHSTIQMLNQDNDSSFNAMVRDVKKLKVVTLKNDTGEMKPSLVKSLVGNIRKESFVDLMQMKRNNQQFLIFFRKDGDEPKEFIGLVNSENSLMVIDLIGNIPVSILPALLNGDVKLSGLASVLNNYKPMKQARRHENHSSNK